MMRRFNVLAVVVVLAVGLSAQAKTHKKKHRSKSRRAQAESRVPAPSPGAETGSVKMDFQVEMDGRLVSSPHVAVVLGQTGTITQTMDDKSFYTIHVTPTKPRAGVVRMNFAISQTVNGQTRLVSNPSVVVLEGEKARIEQKAEGEPSISVEVVAKM